MALGLDPALLGDEDEIDARAQMIEMQQQMAQMQEQFGAPPAGGPGLPAAAGSTPGAPAPASPETDGAGSLVAGRENQLFETAVGSTP